MGIGSDDGQYYEDKLEYLINNARGAKADKKFSDAKEINTNEQANDFQSRFYATDTASRMPPGASTELAGALKSSGGTETPERGVLSKLTGSDGGERFQTWPERLARSAFTLPGDVLSGKVQAGSIQEIERAADLASVMVGGPAPVAKGLADGTLGSFAGVKSKTLPKDKLYEAQNMELDAMHPDDIWEKTGFFRGADSRWRYEIPDANAKLKPEAFDTIVEGQTLDKSKGWTTVDTSTPQGDKIVPKSTPVRPQEFTSHEQLIDYLVGKKKPPLTLDKVLDHPELFKAYPELKTTKVEPLPEFLKGEAAGMHSGDTIYLAEGHPEYVRSVILHEIQHGIQHHEGFAYGGNQTQFLPQEIGKARSLLEEAKGWLSEEFKKKQYSNTTHRLWESSVMKEEEGLHLNPIDRDYIKQAKEEGLYTPIKNVIRAEKLHQEAKEEAFTKYERLMGEVEARNVQARKNFSDNQRKWIAPTRTEDVSRLIQHNPE